MVQEKVESYDPALDGEKGEKEFDETEKIGYFSMIFRYASGGDKCLWVFAAIASIGFGAALPAFCLMFGDMIDSVGGASTAGFGALDDQALYMVYIGMGVFVLAFF